MRRPLGLIKSPGDDAMNDDSPLRSSAPRSTSANGREPVTVTRLRRPRLGFLGAGGTGRRCMEAVGRSGAAEVAAVADVSPAARSASRAAAPEARPCEAYHEMLEEELDGVVIATPSAEQAGHAVEALERGLPVFCQKPLGRNGKEVEAVVEAARRADRYLAVDFPYRFVKAAQVVRDLAQSGTLGTVYAADLVFHNAHGPDKAWLYDPERAGGGCLMDLGGHLVDFASWVLGFPPARRVNARLYAGGRKLHFRPGSVEDYAEVHMDLEGDISTRLACSWNLHAGRDAVVEILFHGIAGSARFSNVGGSLHDFRVEHRLGADTTVLVEPPDDWGGRAAVHWAQRIGRDRHFDPSCTQLVETARTLDAIYRSGASGKQECVADGRGG